MIPPQFVQDLLARIDIADVVGAHVTLKKAGLNLQGLCPFHNEKSPSFSVSPTKQFYHCFGCGAHGTAVGFLIEYSGYTFPEAVEQLAQRVGMAVPNINQSGLSANEHAQIQDQRTRLIGLHENAADFYKQTLKKTPRAIQYLKGRGVSGEIAAKYRLGYAPEAWQGLEQAVPNYDAADLVDAGLVIAKEAKKYDRFRDRVMFPIRSVKGETIAFGGRILDAGEPKYLNSPETPLFSKGQELYGLFEARVAIRQTGFALVTEGYMDVVALAQLGFPQAVATLGTAVGAAHIAKLFRYTDHIVFGFDGDAAGRKAAWRALEASLPALTDVRHASFLFLPPEHDPDSYIREHGQQGFAAAVKAALPLSRFLERELAARHDVTYAEGRTALLAEAKPLVQSVLNTSLRLQMCRALAVLAQVSVAEMERLFDLVRIPSSDTANAGMNTRENNAVKKAGSFTKTGFVDFTSKKQKTIRQNTMKPAPSIEMRVVRSILNAPYQYDSAKEWLLPWRESARAHTRRTDDAILLENLMDCEGQAQRFTHDAAYARLNEVYADTVADQILPVEGDVRRAAAALRSLQLAQELQTAAQSASSSDAATEAYLQLAAQLASAKLASK